VRVPGLRLEKGGGVARRRRGARGSESRGCREEQGRRLEKGGAVAMRARVADTG